MGDMEYLDLDALVVEDKRIRLGGHDYTIPGSIPVKNMIQIIKAGQEVQKDSADESAFNGLMRAYHSVFCIRDLGLTFEVFEKQFDPIVHGPALQKFLMKGVETAEKKTD